MGYDMNFEQEPGEEPGDSFLSLNIFTMATFRQLMSDLGMLDVDYERPEWPSRPKHLTSEDIEAAETSAGGESPGLPVKAEAAAYVKRREAYLAWHPDPVAGIAVHKLVGNDGWLVTPAEIAVALEAYRRHTGDWVRALLDGETDRWLQWITFLERAQRRGGFRVW